MPYRNMTLWVVLAGIAGLVLLATLALMGRNVHHLARRGPRWMRLLLIAALALLGLGSAGCDDAPSDSDSSLGNDVVSCYEPTHIPTTMVSLQAKVLSPDVTPAQQAQWDKAVALWKRAQDISARAAFSYPLSEKEQADLLADLKQARADIAALHEARRIAKPTADLLDAELASLTQDVQAFRPEPSPKAPMATCYKPISTPTPAAKSLDQLKTRLSMLEALAETGQVTPAVVAQVAGIIGQDIDVLDNPTYRGEQLDSAKQKEAEQLAGRADALLRKLNAPVEPAPITPLTSLSQWQQIAKLRTRAQTYADSGSTEAQRKQFDKDLAEAKQNLQWLGQKGYLSHASAGLITNQLDDLKTAVYSTPPIDSKVMCYRMATALPAEASLDRLTQQVPQLQAMLERDIIRPEVVEALLPRLREDVRTLTDNKQFIMFGQNEKAARALVAKAQNALASLEAFLEHPSVMRPAPVEKPK